MSGTWFCNCGKPTCRNTYIDLERVAEERMSYIRFRTGDDDGERSVFDVPVVLLAMMFDAPEAEQQVEYGNDYGFLALDCYGGDFDMETPDGYTSLLIDDEFIVMLKGETHGTAK